MYIFCGKEFATQTGNLLPTINILTFQVPSFIAIHVEIKLSF